MPNLDSLIRIFIQTLSPKAGLEHGQHLLTTYHPVTVQVVDVKAVGDVLLVSPYGIGITKDEYTNLVWI